MSQPSPLTTTSGVFDHYHPLASYDEAVDGNGKFRNHWQPLFNHLQSLNPQHVHALREQSRQLLLENGITYDAYNTSPDSSRTWDLDLLPWIIAEEEWHRLEKGLRQHHRLLEALLNDLYGNQRLFTSGILPAALIYGDNAFLRCCQGWQQTGQLRIPWGAVDLIRGVDGSFLIVGNPLQTPTGIGYALENRQIFFRLLRDPLNENRVRLLLPFFTALRNNLIEASPHAKEDPNTVLLTPGPGSPVYFEHAFLANYLGLPLVMGEDLTVRGGKVHFKTLDGLHPVDVILRLLEDRYCDPLEMTEEANPGVAGLVQAVREHRTAVVNPLGVGILENLALRAYWPELCRYYLQEDPLLNVTPTWWCGDPRGLEVVLDQLDELIVHPINDQKHHLPFAQLPVARQKEIRQDLQKNPRHYLAHPKVHASSLPILGQEGITSGHGVLRTFFTAGSQGVEIMPGGLARVTRQGQAASLFEVASGFTKDVWIRSSQPVARANRPPLESLSQPAVFTGELSSRTAENLFWMGRYSERAENILRLLRVVVLLPSGQTEASRLILRAVTLLTATQPGFIGTGAEECLLDPEPELLRIITSSQVPGSMVSTLQALVLASHRVRDRLSNDTWRVIHRLRIALQRLSTRQRTAELLGDLEELITTLGSLAGLAMENMTRGLGWHFMVMGRRLERAILTVELLKSTLSSNLSGEGERVLLETLLAATDCTMTFRRRYRTHLYVRPFLDLILLDETNPRSVAFQLEGLEHHIANLPRRVPLPVFRTPEGRIILESLNEVRLANTDLLAMVGEEGERKNLLQLLNRLQSLLPMLSVQLSNSYFQHATPHSRRETVG